MAAEAGMSLQDFADEFINKAIKAVGANNGKKK